MELLKRAMSAHYSMVNCMVRKISKTTPEKAKLIRRRRRQIPQRYA
uniref:Uncharacterized protein n=1 Tax=Wuchereria bancrofti TaxID=6293 RepID=A0AAF5Q765_WUCBA